MCLLVDLRTLNTVLTLDIILASTIRTWQSIICRVQSLFLVQLILPYFSLIFRNKTIIKLNYKKNFNLERK